MHMATFCQHMQTFTVRFLRRKHTSYIHVQDTWCVYKSSVQQEYLWCVFSTCNRSTCGVCIGVQYMQQEYLWSLWCVYKSSVQQLWIANSVVIHLKQTTRLASSSDLPRLLIAALDLKANPKPRLKAWGGLGTRLRQDFCPGYNSILLCKQ